jgi:hypothetical protein
VIERAGPHFRREGQDQPSADRQRVEPGLGRSGRAGMDEDEVGRGQRHGGAVARGDADLWQPGQGTGREGREIGIVLDAEHLSLLAGEAGQLSAPEPEVRALVAEAARDADALRRLVMRAVDRAEEGAGPPPGAFRGMPSLRRP